MDFSTREIYLFQHAENWYIIVSELIQLFERSPPRLSAHERHSVMRSINWLLTYLLSSRHPTWHPLT